jgi:hypothetical protein
MTRRIDHSTPRRLFPLAVACLGLVVALSAAAPSANAGSLFDVAPNDRDAYVKVDFVKLAASPHTANLLGFLEKGLKVSVFGLPPASGIDFGKTAKEGLVVVHAGKTRLTYLSGSFDLAATRTWLQAQSVASAKKAEESTANARAKEAEAAKAGKREPKELKAKAPSYVFAEESIGDKPALAVPGGVFLLFWSPQLVVAGTKHQLEQYLAAIGGKDPASKGRLLTTYGKLPDRSAPMWWLAENPERKRATLKKKGKTMLADVLADAGSMSLEGDALLKTVFVTASEESAKGFAAHIEAQLAKFKGKFLVRSLGVAAMLEGMSIKAEGKQVRVEHKLKKPQVEVLLKVGAQLLGLFKR